MLSTPATVARSAFTFYDLESTRNVFSVSAYSPARDEATDRTGVLEVFYLVDDAPDGTNLADRVDPKRLGDAIFAANPSMPAFPATRLFLYDLRRPECVYRLAQLVGLSDADNVCDPDSRSAYPAELRPVCDTDPGYDPARHPFRVGYNSLSYDTTMLALYLVETYPTPSRPGCPFHRTTARTMRRHNDGLFRERNMRNYLSRDDPAWHIRRAMLQSGRHLDATGFNESQRMVALKRQLGTIGRQILESEKLTFDSVIGSLDELHALLAYNVADCVGLGQLMHDPFYATKFDQKASLLVQWPDTVYDAHGRVRWNRATVDTTSARFIATILAPDKPLQDVERVSYVYPHPTEAAAMGIEPRNVLDEAVEFFESRVSPDPATHVVTPQQAEAHHRFMEVVAYYRDIEGRNFNDSDRYRRRFGAVPVSSLPDIPKRPNTLPYFHADASPSSCHVVFSYGGIHGAEANMALYESDLAWFEHRLRCLATAREAFPNPVDLLDEAKRQFNELVLPDGSTVNKQLVMIGSDPQKARWRKPDRSDPEQAEQLSRARAAHDTAGDLLAAQPPRDRNRVRLPNGLVADVRQLLSRTTRSDATYHDPDELTDRRPALFTVMADGSSKLAPRYRFTSALPVVHEDFDSYYPNLLMRMRAFDNPELGEDRYRTCYGQKEVLGVELKQLKAQPVRDKARVTVVTTERESQKLLLNAASGAADTNNDTPIRMNNRIISMRIIGQLKAWRIGQEHVLASTRVPSTNTDGLYPGLDPAHGYDETWNNRVLASASASVGVRIEPEVMHLVSKDANNRMELAAPAPGDSLAGSRVLDARGAALQCWEGPRVDKALAHPAVRNFALVHYLRTVVARGGQDALFEPFDPVLGHEMVRRTVDHDDPVHTLLMFQRMLAASRSSISYPFAADLTDEPTSEPTGARPLQMHNRVFVVRPGTQGATSLRMAAARAVPTVETASRARQGLSRERTDVVALRILEHQGWARDARTAQALGHELIPTDQKVVVTRIPGIDPTWPMLVVNEDLHVMDPARRDALIDALDLDVYTEMLGAEYEQNWRNTLAPALPPAVPASVTSVAPVSPTPAAMTA